MDGLFRRIELGKYFGNLVKKRRKQTERFIKKENFRTGLIELPELGLSVNLGPNQFYRLEVATDLFEREEEIYDCYMQRHAIVYHASRSRLNGLCIPLRDFQLGANCRANIILVKANLNEPTKTYVTGHENGHFLFNMGLKNQFYQHYSVSERIQDQIKDTEDFAMFCGNIAMANAKHNLSEIRSVSPNSALLEKEQKARELVIEVLPEQFYNSLFRQRRL